MYIHISLSLSPYIYIYIYIYMYGPYRPCLLPTFGSAPGRPAPCNGTVALVRVALTLQHATLRSRRHALLLRHTLLSRVARPPTH